MQYQLRRQMESIGGIALEIECLESLDRTIDDLFAELERTGNASLLEELCPYFGTLWPSARALAGAVAALGERLRGQRILELGCGLAVPSLVALKLGARVTATDFHPEVPLFLERNLALNGLKGLEYVRVNWDADATGFPELGSFDYVIGSDVLYEKSHALNLAAVIERYLGPGGLSLIADPARPYLQSFVDEMSRRSFSHESSAGKDVFLLKFERASLMTGSP